MSLFAAEPHLSSISDIVEAARHSYTENGYCYLKPGASIFSSAETEALQQFSAEMRGTQLTYENSRFGAAVFAGFDTSSQQRKSVHPSADAILGILLSPDKQPILNCIMSTGVDLSCGTGVFNRYRPGDHMELHADVVLTGKDLGSLIVGLQDDYEGGRLLVYPKNQPHIVELEMRKNALVLLSPGLKHEVTEVTAGFRETASLILIPGRPIVEFS